MAIVRVVRPFVLTFLILVLASPAVRAQATQTPPASAPAPSAPLPYEPVSGQEGKDVVWVPTSEALVEKMLDLAKVTASDYVMDLGSGDGRTVIAAAKRGATAQGIEYNPDMVALSKKRAAEAGVADRATFLAADLFTTDFSKASVITMFLLSTINEKLRPQILDLAPGTRVVSNTFRMGDWEPDQEESVTDCVSWCTALLWIVPAKVEGTWNTAGGPLVLTQKYQTVSGTLGGAPISGGGLRGREIHFTVGDVEYTGRVDGATMEGTLAGGRTGMWSATRQ